MMSPSRRRRADHACRMLLGGRLVHESTMENADMASKEQCDRYAAELVARFDDLTRWAIANWPRADFPLMHSDFSEARKEISRIIGPKLGDCDAHSEPQRKKDNPQYTGINPAPWP